MINKIGLFLLSLPMRVVRFYAQVFKYLWQVVKLAGLNALVMIPLCYLTAGVMMLLGLNVDTHLDRMLPIDDPTLLILFSFAVIIGILEETLYRYLLMDSIMIRWLKIPAKLAIALSSVLFGLSHLMNTPGDPLASLPQAVGAVGAGVVFANVYRHYEGKDGLHMAIMTHAMYDFAMFVIMFKM